MENELKPIDDYPENVVIRIGKFIAKRLGIEFYCDCSIDRLLTALNKGEIENILAKMERLGE